MSTHSVSRWIGAATVLIALLLATAMQAFAAPVAVPVAAPEAVQCTSFEDLALGTVYHVGDTFASNGLNFAVRQFVWADGTPTAAGFIEVENGGLAGGVGQELEVNNSNLEVVLAAAVDGLRFRFGEYGGNLNIAINGDFRNFANLADIDGLVIGGVNISVLNGFGNDRGGVRAVGAINTFAVGGQEFYVDDLCLGQDNPAQDPQGSRPDLGDAPDSSNHFTKTMEAYVGIKALFPTVFDPATGLPQGPMHVFPRPFHLGQLVSQEVEADRGPDVDPTNNILPLRALGASGANLDRHDDGLRPNLLSFTDCATTTIPVEVFISPRAAAHLAEQQGLGYLNVWLDSNRDGDWEDVAQCPAPVGGLPGVALEHIAIDQPVNVTTLGPGLHVIRVRTGLVAWDAKLSEKPAWLRVTLSERPANKTLTAGGINYGDGRGYDRPFALGETEDYKLHFGQPVDGADVMIRKEGAVRQDFEGEPGFVNGEVIWHINYHNLGSEVASSVRISDVLPTGIPVEDARLEVRSVPNLAYTRDGNTLVFNGGDLEPGHGGNIVLRVKFRMAVEQLPTLTNKVVISANNDGNAENNMAEATVQLGLRSPLITGPGNGTTCNNTVEIHGRAVPASEVDLYIDGVLIATLHANATDGRWTHTATLADGTHTLSAIARKNGLTSPASATVTVIVDSSLAYDPLSLRLIDANGNVRRPVDETGRTDADGWSVRLRANMHYTLTVKICCTDPNASATIEVPVVGEVALTYAAARDLYVGSFTTGDRAEDPQPEPMSLTVVCGDNEITFGGKILIDPEGVVYDVNTRQPISAAQVSCLEAVATAGSTGNDSAFSLWPAADYDQINPQSTLADGYFSFWTPAGTYRLAASHAGYQPYRSVDIAVVDELVHYDVWLTPNIADAATQVIEMGDEGFNPAIVTVQPGAVIEWVNLDVDGHTATSDDLVVSATSGAAAVSWDSGLLTGGESYKLRLNSAGTFTYVDRTNPANTATIIVSQATGNPDTGQVLIYLPMVQK